MSEQPEDSVITAHKRKLIPLVGDDGGNDIELAVPQNKRSKKLHPEASKKPLLIFTHLLDSLGTLEFEVFKEVVPKEIIGDFQRFLDPKTLYSFYQTCKYANAFDLRIRGQMPYSYWATVSPLSLLATTDKNAWLFQPGRFLNESIFVYQDRRGKKRSLFRKKAFLQEVWILATLSGSFKILGLLMARYIKTTYPFTYIKSLKETWPEISKYEPFSSVNLKKFQSRSAYHGPYASSWVELTVMVLAMFDTTLLKRFVVSDIGQEVAGYDLVVCQEPCVQLLRFQEFVRDCGAWAGNLETIKYHHEIDFCTQFSVNLVNDMNYDDVEKEVLQNIRDCRADLSLSAMANATYQGHLDVLKYLVENDNSKKALSRTNDQHYLCREAIFGGKLNCLEYLLSLNCVPHPDCCRQAANVGKLEILKYFHENNRDDGFLWDGVVGYLAHRGHLVGLTWALENNIPFKLDTLFDQALMSKKPLTVLPVLHKYLCECIRKNTVLPCELTFDELTVWIFKSTLILKESDIAVEIVAWFFENNYQYHPMDSLIYHAFKQGQFGVIVWLRDNYFQFQWPTPKLLIHRYVKHLVRDSSDAHEPTHLTLNGLNWLLNESYPHAVDYYKLFVKNGLTDEAMEWAYNRGFSLTAEIFTFTLNSINPKIRTCRRRLLKWLIKHDCPQDPTIDYKSISPKLEAKIAQWNIQKKRGILK